jgi:hypothetical protein
MIPGLDGIIYLAGSAVLLAMYQTRRNRLSRFCRQNFPELDGPTFSELKQLLESCYERMLFLGIGLLVLASVSLSGLSAGLKAFFLVVVFVLFFANIAPRHRLMKMLLAKGISPEKVREVGVKL